MLEDCLELKESIEKETGFALSFEGILKWIAFIHFKQNDILPVPNRYFGVYENGTLKIRGIEARRHDTPVFFCKFQQEVLEIMSKGNNINEVKALESQQSAIKPICMLRIRGGLSVYSSNYLKMESLTLVK
jgi:DNA polymerase elongation subunit (family B)